MSIRARFYVGVTLLVIGTVMPFGVFFVTSSGLPSFLKTAISGILFFGFEIMALPAVAVMGKENFDRIMSRVKRWMGNLKPADNIRKGSPLYWNSDVSLTHYSNLYYGIRTALVAR